VGASGHEAAVVVVVVVVIIVTQALKYFHYLHQFLSIWPLVKYLLRSLPPHLSPNRLQVRLDL